TPSLIASMRTNFLSSPPITSARARAGMNPISTSASTTLLPRQTEIMNVAPFYPFQHWQSGGHVIKESEGDELGVIEPEHSIPRPWRHLAIAGGDGFNPRQGRRGLHLIELCCASSS